MLFGLTSQCFTGDTLVSTEYGLRPIEDIQVGDYVWSENTETGEKELKKVLSVSVTETTVLVHVYTEDGTEINTTENHPFFVEGKGWCVASELEQGDVLHTQDGSVEIVSDVTIEQLEEAVKVYNLEIEDSHTYYVSDREVLVHNRCELGENMINDPDGIGDPGPDFDAHHIFPQKFKDIFKIIGIDINDSDFGIWIEKHKHRSGAKAYNKKWEDFFAKFDNVKDITFDDIIKFLEDLDEFW
ncbi:MAG: polymorphic toxin-type HINT domain-containing protein [Lachnospiraceae bacterium]